MNDWNKKFNEVWKIQVDLALKNSKYKVGEMFYNEKTKHYGPIQRLAYSNNKVIYYHGNNPCNEDELTKPVKRRKLI